MRAFLRATRALLALVIGVASMGFAAPVALAGYGAAYAGQCCYETLEQGDRRTEYFDFKNTGDVWWYRYGLSPNPVNLATGTPDGGPSPFYVPGAWLSDSRAGSITNKDAVPPGETGRFSFLIQAPLDLGTTRNQFTLLAEGATVFGQRVSLDWTVIPAVPPSAAIVDTATSVVVGSPLSVTARAADNLAVASVTATLGAGAGAAMAATTDSRYAVGLPTATLTPGDYDLSVTASDPGGRQTKAQQTVHVLAPPVPAAEQPSPAGPSSSAPGVSTSTPDQPALRKLGAIVPLFATRAKSARGQFGQLLSLRTAALPAGASLSMACVAGCRAWTKRAPLKLTTTPTGVAKGTLHRPWPLSTATRVAVTVSAAGYTTATRKYRFTKTASGVRATVRGVTQ